MADRELNINLRLNRSQATTEAERFEQGEKARIKSVERAHQDAEAAKLNVSRRSHAERIQAAEKATTAEVVFAKRAQSSMESAKAATLSVKGATDQLGQSLVGLGTSYLGVQGITKAFDALRKAVADANAEIKRLGGDVVASAQGLGELAAARGVAPDSRLALDVTRTARRTLTPVDQTRQFLTTLEGSSADAMARMGQMGFRTFAEDALRLGTALNVDPQSMALFAGQTLRAGKFADPKAAMQTMGGMMKQLQASPAAVPKLIADAVRIMSRVGTDPMLSQVTALQDVIPLVGLGEITQPGEGGAYAENLLKGVRLASDSDVGRRLGLDSTANVRTVLPKLIPYLKAQAAKGRPLHQVLDQDFQVRDMQAAAMLSTAVQQSDTFLRDLAGARDIAGGEAYVQGVIAKRESADVMGPLREDLDRQLAEAEQAAQVGALGRLTESRAAGTRAVRAGATTTIRGRLNLAGASLGVYDQDEAAKNLENYRASMFGRVTSATQFMPGIEGIYAGGYQLAYDILQEMNAGIKQLVGLQQATTNPPPPVLTRP